MRQKRAKTYRKLMSLYRLSFSFREPYQVLGTSMTPFPLPVHVHAHLTSAHPVDAEMCRIAIESRIDLVKQLGTVLQGTVKPSTSLSIKSHRIPSVESLQLHFCLHTVITQCSIHELYLQGKAQQPAVDLAKTFERRKCNHKEAIPGDECLASVVGTTKKHLHAPIHDCVLIYIVGQGILTNIVMSSQRCRSPSVLNFV